MLLLLEEGNGAADESFRPPRSPRFKTEAEEVTVNVKVMALQAALNESTVKYATFQKVCYNVQLS